MKTLTILSVLALVACCANPTEAASAKKPAQLVLGQEVGVIGKDDKHVRVAVPAGDHWCRIQYPDGGVVRESTKLCTALHEALEAK